MMRSVQRANKTGLLYHEDMLEHRCTWDDNHIEVPERMKRSYDKCVERQLVEKCIILKPKLASLDEIREYHESDYVAELSNCAELDECELEKIACKFDDVYLCKETSHAALLAAGSTIVAMNAVMTNQCDNAMALVRPPGHHAMTNEANGFCIFNNVVIAVKKALHDFSLERILVPVFYTYLPPIFRLTVLFLDRRLGRSSRPRRPTSFLRRSESFIFFHSSL